MATLTRINLAYVLLGGISARYLVDSAFFDLEAKFTESLAALTSLTSLFSGLLIVLSFHHIFNVWLIRLIGKIRKDDHYRFKIEITSKSDFTEIIDNVYGNTLITLILAIATIAYFYPNSLLKTFQIPLVDQEHNLIISFILLIITIGMLRNTFLSWNNWKNRLNYFTYYEFLLSILETSISEDLQKYRDNISSNWDKVEEEYKQIQKNITRSLTYLETIIPKFCDDYNRQQSELTKYLDIGEPQTWGNNISNPLNPFWEKWYEPPRQFQNILDNFSTLKSKGFIHFLKPDLRKEFITVFKEYDSGRKIFHNFKKNEEILNKAISMNISENLKYIENGLRKLLVLKQFAEEPVVESFLSNLRSIFSKNFDDIDKFSLKKAVIRPEDYQKEKLVSDILVELGQSRREVLTTCHSLCENKSNHIKIIEKCIEYQKPKSLKEYFAKKFRKKDST